MDISELLTNKEKLLKFIIDTISSNEKSAERLRNLIDSNGSDTFKVKKLLEVVANQSIQIKTLSMIMLVYSSNKNFDTDVAMIMNKMGRGQEALKLLFKQKIRE